jgi:hypothetical protein
LQKQTAVIASNLKIWLKQNSIHRYNSFAYPHVVDNNNSFYGFSCIIFEMTGKFRIFYRQRTLFVNTALYCLPAGRISIAGVF